MVLVRRRYYFWLIKAYVKRWRKTIFTSILLGGVTFFLFLLGLNYYVLPLVRNSVEKIGYEGSYTLSTLPEEILSDVSYGLTTISPNGQINPGAAYSWKISDGGKKYTFVLRGDLRLNNGKSFTAQDVPYKFKDVKKEVINPTTISFTLKDSYAPFLSVVSRPIIVNNYGLGKYHISKIEQNAGFIKTLTLYDAKAKQKRVYLFYPTQQALKTAFLLGEVNSVENLTPATSPDTTFKDWKNINVKKEPATDQLVAIFFNTTDSSLGNKKVRQALVYALPASFSEGKRTYSFLDSSSVYYSKSPNEGLVDIDLAKSLLSDSKMTNVKITIDAPEDLLPVAEKVAAEWKKLGIKVDIKQVDGLQTDFQALLYTMRLPKDPDVYTIWHSNQDNNISHYKSVRIDKLLEDGRQATDNAERVQIYGDLQKYLLDDAPAAFLYFPYSYTISRN